VVQSVYRSFFARCVVGQFECDSWRDLWSLLTVITVRKCRDRADYFLAQRRSADAEVADGPEPWDAVDREPTPDEALLLAETVEELLRGFDADDRAVIELSLQEYTVVEISARLGRAERTVRRLRERVRKRLQRLLAGEE
jgi:RNA polymerase sigma factor (sigma-70 family)